MTACDPHRFINDLDKSLINKLVDRLESRSQDEIFTRLLDKYVAYLDLKKSSKILEIGCGTGAVLRRLCRQHGFCGHAYGVDQSLTFIQSAQCFSDKEGLAGRITFKLGNAHNLEFPSGSFDVVVAHTVISHVADPEMVLQEMVRVVRSDGIIVIFDGDYASLTYAYPDYEFGRKMDASLVTATFNNPCIMRDLPRLFKEYDLALKHAWGDAVAEIGQASYFRSFAETYAQFVGKSGLVPEEEVESWLAIQNQAMADGTFFAACNYYTYIAKHSG